MLRYGKLFKPKGLDSPKHAWYVRVYDTELRKHSYRSTTFAKREFAQRQADEWQRLEFVKESETPECTWTLREAGTLWRKSLVERTTVGYRRRVKSDSARWEKAFPRRLVRHLKTQEIDEWLTSLTEGGMSRTMRNQVRSSMSSLFRWLVKRGEITRNPVEPIPELTTPTPQHADIPDEHFERLFAALDPDPRYRWVEHFFRVMYWSGARQEMLLKTRWCDVNLRTGHWNVDQQHTKNRRPWRAKMHRECCLVLRRHFEWVAEYHGTDFCTPVTPIFPRPKLARRKTRASHDTMKLIARNTWHTAREKAGLPHFKPQALRRRYENHLRRAGASDSLWLALQGRISRDVLQKHYVTVNDAEVEGILGWSKTESPARCCPRCGYRL